MSAWTHWREQMQNDRLGHASTLHAAALLSKEGYELQADMLRDFIDDTYGAQEGSAEGDTTSRRTGPKVYGGTAGPSDAEREECRKCGGSGLWAGAYAPHGRGEYFCVACPDCAEREHDMVVEIERLRGQVEALAAGAPVVRCCEHCELCRAESGADAEREELAATLVHMASYHFITDVQATRLRRAAAILRGEP